MKNKFYLKIYSVKRKKWTYFINTFILCFVIFKFLISSENMTTNLVSIIILLITICFNSFSSWLNGAESLFAWKKTKTVEYSPYVSIKIKKSEDNYQVTFKYTGRGELYNLNIMVLIYVKMRNLPLKLLKTKMILLLKSLNQSL